MKIGRLVALMLLLATNLAIQSVQSAAAVFSPPAITAITSSNLLQPAVPRSVETYSVTATISSPGGISNIQKITMCWYQTGASSVCSNAQNYPKQQFLMTWTRATNHFQVMGTNFYSDSGSSIDFTNITDLQLGINFRFKVSQAMLAGANWNVSLQATDIAGQTSTVGTGSKLSGITVGYFAAVIVDLAPIDYGIVKSQESATSNPEPGGVFVANGATNIYISATDFVYEADSMALDTVNANPMAGKVSMLCSPGDIFSEGSAILVSNLPSLIFSSAFVGGTGEASREAPNHTCQLRFGGGSVRRNVIFSNTVGISFQKAG